MARSAGCCSTKPGRIATRKPLLWGLAGMAGMLAFYASLLSILNSPLHAWQEFVRMWYWVVLLAAGFGIQIGLYAHVRQAIKEATGTVVASGGISGTSMAACCAHHLSEVLPVIGLGAAGAFLLKYQIAFMTAGVISSLVGIVIMLRHIRKHALYSEGGVLAALLKQQHLLYAVAGLAALILIIIGVRTI